MMRVRVLIILIVLYFIYMIIGAVVFMIMERQPEKDRCAEAKLAKKNWLNQTREEKGFTEDMLNGFIKNVTRFAGFGISLQGEVKCPINWDFQSSLFFTGTIITTIGYGNLAPTLWYSQIFCIIYALFGIPLFAIMFSGIGQYLSLMVEKLLHKLQKKYESPLESKMIHAVLSFCLICGGSLIIFQLIPAIIFTFVEGWSYRESFYYCFITLTTIGFGDFVAGTNPEIKYIALYRVMVLFWILFGLAYTFTAIDLIINSIRKAFLKSKVADWLVDNWAAAEDELHSELESLMGAGSSGGPEETDRIGEGEERPLLGLDAEGEHVSARSFGATISHAGAGSGSRSSNRGADRNITSRDSSHLDSEPTTSGGTVATTSTVTTNERTRPPTTAHDGDTSHADSEPTPITSRGPNANTSTSNERAGPSTTTHGSDSDTSHEDSEAANINAGETNELATTRTTAAGNIATTANATTIGAGNEVRTTANVVTTSSSPVSGTGNASDFSS